MCRTTKLNQGPHSPPPSSSFLVLLLLLLLWSDFFRFFTLGEKLGQGATGKVFKATLKEVPEGTEPTTYAVKRIRRWGLRAPAKKALHWEVIFFFFPLLLLSFPFLYCAKPCWLAHRHGAHDAAKVHIFVSRANAVLQYTWRATCSKLLRSATDINIVFFIAVFILGFVLPQFCLNVSFRIDFILFSHY